MRAVPDGSQLPDRASQPAGAAAGLALVRQDREQVAPVPGDLGQEGGLAAPPGQVPHLRDHQQFGIPRRRGRPGGAGSGPLARMRS